MHANTYIWNLREKEKTVMKNQGQDGNKDRELLENGLQDMGRGKGKL